ncbi:NEO1 Probable phospholipid-transporting ATPase NEO1 [Candida maltosa Xu316]|uniref:Phospholipid-transporting ATPase n=1 Tax=Candida maltosa (strain Xu316) TaxID=1245528 RepID=M3IKN7_CANMX|nr:Phospholipid-transporting ATPase, putative [Candida maltosa Xu316]
MSSSTPFSFDERDSFDDLDSSLDKALNSATNNLFKYHESNGNSKSHNGTRSNSQASVGAIPLATLHPDNSFEDHDDSAPLIANTNIYSNPQNHSRTSSSSSLNIAARSLSSKFKRIIRKSVQFFNNAKRELDQDRLKLSGSSDYRNSSHPHATDERYISAKTTNLKANNIYPSNAISNAKYNPITFIPIILYEQFKFFFNLYFLVVALSQIIPQLRIGYLSSYIVPLAFVLTVTMMKEAGDDIQRRRRDKEQNNELYEVLNRSSSDALTTETKLVPASGLRVGDLVRLHKDVRIPADMVLLQSSEHTGEVFIKTDQLDGETDWKLRIACNATQQLQSVLELIDSVAVIVGNPTKSIHHFNGQLVYKSQSGSGSASPTSNNETFAISVDQSLWANTVLASGTAIGMVIYTGVETRQSMNTTKSGVKTGLLELEINSLSKILCAVVFVLSVVLVLAHGFPLKSTWYIDIMRFLILFSAIIPVSLRVNLDLAKSVYASQIQNDDAIAGTIVRTSTIPEDLGRIEYLLSDKTGTLTQNEMELKKLHLGSVSYAGDSMDVVSDYVKLLLKYLDAGQKKRDLGSRVCELVLTLALCHNVTPTYDEEDDENLGEVTYQAASPDEIAIVKYCESVGLKLFKRDRHSITLLHVHSNHFLEFEILYSFPFSSETKRMGIIIKDKVREDIWFMQKGADTVMSNIVNANDWLDEETGNMAREGLRTLVIGRKKLSNKIYDDFVDNYTQASISMHDRDNDMQKVVSYYLEQHLELLGLTGVEDRLQHDVKSSIELLRNAGIKIWMLTGDKVETAKCVSISARLISRGQYVHQITKVSRPEMAMNQLEYLKINTNACLLIDGESLATYMKHFSNDFFEIAIKLPAVIACRCSPQQKADVAVMIRKITGKRVCCIGDGGNDVSMIQCADVGVGIVGKEGKQASLAADFSIDQFCYLSKLLLWHGRNSYKRSAKLSQFIIHRGLLISVAQAVYSIASKFEPLALYQGWLMVGYSTIYTMAPVFSLTLDCDIDEHLTKLYPELYKELTLGKSLSYKTFFMWVFISLYQGSAIQLLSQQFQTLLSDKFTTMVALSFSCLVYNELIMVAMSINKWNKIMASTIIITFLAYIGSIPFLSDYFDLTYITSFSYYWQTALVLVISLFPVWLVQYLNRRLRPPNYAKVQQD